MYADICRRMSVSVVTTFQRVKAEHGAEIGEYVIVAAIIGGAAYVFLPDLRGQIKANVDAITEALSGSAGCANADGAGCTSTGGGG